MKAVHAPLKQGTSFLDLFSGSGVVSRFAKSLGFEVFCNDWEEYANILSLGFVKFNETDIESLFGSKELFKKEIEYINNLPNPSENEQYIAKYYAPQSFDTDNVDFNTERLFYTRNNALSIDKIRNYIEKKYPDKDNPKRNLLLAILIYEGATHTNTSGVFKSFHKGFGGHGKDALKRILAPIKLHEPFLINSDYPVHVYREDANSLVYSKKLPRVEIAYLDPPYNQHQYGSNYHMLNTIALWDKVPAPLILNEKGVLAEKAAIRKDWVLTKSLYCYKNTALESFANLLAAIDAHYIFISYSTDGIIPFADMERLCLQKGKVSIVTNEYTTYRGGKQSNSKATSNIEFILAIDTTKKSSSASSNSIEHVLSRKKLLLLFKNKYNASRLIAYGCSFTNGILTVPLRKKKVEIPCRALFELSVPDNIHKYSINQIKALHNILSDCSCATKLEELEEILKRLDSIYVNEQDKIYLVKLIPNTLKKLAQKNSKLLFKSEILKIKSLKKTHSSLYALIEDKIKIVESLANVRFSN